MVYFKESYNFLRFQGCPTCSMGVNLLHVTSMETYRTCDFSGGGGGGGLDPVPHPLLDHDHYVYHISLIYCRTKGFD